MEDDAFLESLVDDTLAPYRGLVPDWILADMRVLTRATFASHPVARQLIEELRERPAQERSGAIGEDAEDDEAANGGDR